MPRLSLEQFRQAQELLTDCFTQALTGFTPEQREEVGAWVTELTTMNKVWSFRPDFLESTRNRVFDHPTILNFLQELHFLFFIAVGDQPATIDRLCQNLIDGLVFDGIDPDHSIVPNEVAISMPRNIFKQAPSWLAGLLGMNKTSGIGSANAGLYLFLRNNTWFVLILLLSSLSADNPGQS
jgi:hypothetical protein